MSEQGTQSIAFSIAECGLGNGGEISFNNDPALDPLQTSWLTDPNAPRDALQNLRILKTRETGNQAQIPITTGRARRSMIDFTQHNYMSLQMRRKAGVLQHSNKEYISKKSEYSKIITRKNNKSSRARLKKLIDSTDCEELDPITKIASNSGIKNGKTYLYLNKNIPFYSSI